MAKKMTSETFVANVLSCLGAPYKSPGVVNLESIQQGAGVDCSGLLTAASNGMIYHGSNTIWRTELTDKGSISDGKPTDPYPQSNAIRSTQLQPGMAVFKWNSSDVKHDGLGDYQHIGVVTGVSPLRITHASSGSGVITDTKIGKWCAWGYLVDIDYTGQQQVEPEQEDQMSVYVKITASSLRIREQATTDSDQIGLLHAGEVVQIAGQTGDWYKLAGRDGYISARYTKPAAAPAQSEQDDQQPEQVKPEQLPVYVTVDMLRDFARQNDMIEPDWLMKEQSDEVE